MFIQKTRLIFSVITSSLLVTAFIPSTRGIAQAQPHPTPLLHSRCVSSGIGSAQREEQDISVGRAVYTSQFYLGPGNQSASLTCNIKPDNSPQPIFQTLNLNFGMRDNDIKSPGVEISIYLDGRPAGSQMVVPSQQGSLSLNVGNVSNVSIEATCSSRYQYCNRVYFYDATLQRPPSIQQKRS